MNWSTAMAVAKTEALAVTDKLVAMTRGQQTGTDNNQLWRWWACRGIGKVAAAAQPPHGGIVGTQGGRWVCCSVSGAATRRR
jgi:hypothetical protein